MSAQPPKRFTESELGKIRAIKELRAAEAAEKSRLETEALWAEYQAEGSTWVAEALENKRRREEAVETKRVRAEVQKWNELEQVKAEVLAEVVITENDLPEG